MSKDESEKDAAARRYWQNYYARNKYRGVPSLKELVEIIRSNNTYEQPQESYPYVRKDRMKPSEIENIAEKNDIEIDKERLEAYKNGYITVEEYHRKWGFSKSRKSVKKSKRSRKSVKKSKRSRKSVKKSKRSRKSVKKSKRSRKSLKKSKRSKKSVRASKRSRK
jgi:hypothetical protein